MEDAIVQRLRGRAAVVQRRRRMERTHWLCEHCLREGRTEAAKVVNHIIPLTHGGSDEDDNTENLCKRHDDIATAKQFGFKPKAEIGLDGWPVR